MPTPEYKTKQITPEIFSARKEEFTSVYRAAFNAPPWDEDCPEETAKASLTWVMNNEASGRFVEQDGKVIGLIMGQAHPFMTNGLPGTKFHLHELCVTPAFQNAGHGTNLLRDLQTYLKEKYENVQMEFTTHEKQKGFFLKNLESIEKENSMVLMNAVLN